jgi:putative tricarboxylic transport membrane protein
METGQIPKREALFWMVLGAFICFLGWRIKIGNFHAPGPGFFALVAGLSLLLIGALMLFSRAASKPESSPDSGTSSATVTERVPVRRLLGTMALLAAYAVFLNSLGFILCTFLVMWGLFYDWGKNRLATAFLASLVTTVVTYTIFEVWLRSQLPRGILPWW